MVGAGREGLRKNKFDTQNNGKLSEGDDVSGSIFNLIDM